MAPRSKGSGQFLSKKVVMGNWNISIQGTGCHHNRKLKSDANRLAAQFVQTLRDMGHQVTSATFTHGAVDYIDGQAYINTRNEIEGGEPK